MESSASGRLRFSGAGRETRPRKAVFTTGRCHTSRAAESPAAREGKRRRGAPTRRARVLNPERGALPVFRGVGVPLDPDRSKEMP